MDTVAVRTEKECRRCGVMQPLSRYGQKRATCKSCCNRRGEHFTDDEWRLRRVWKAMRERCSRPGNDDFPRYGGRGIAVCDGWSRFKPFLAWAKTAGYEQGLEIDRINNDGNYCPENCRFVTRAVNARNRSTVKLTVEQARQIRTRAKAGERMTIIAAEFGVHPSTVSNIRDEEIWRNI